MAVRIWAPADVGVGVHKCFNIKMEVALGHFSRHYCFNHFLQELQAGRQTGQVSRGTRETVCVNMCVGEDGGGRRKSEEEETYHRNKFVAAVLWTSYGVGLPMLNLHVKIPEDGTHCKW